MKYIILNILTPLLPIIFLLIGGQHLLDRYGIKKRKQESEIELRKKIKEEKYLVIHKVYDLFSEFMRLYRKMNSPLTDLNDNIIKSNLFEEIIKAESQIDGLILEISCEYYDERDDTKTVTDMLGNFRQSIQIWRERLVNSEKLPFTRSFQDDYVRFKKAFAEVASYMIGKIHEQVETPDPKMEKIETLIIESFDNKYEKWNLTNKRKTPKLAKYYSDYKRR